MAHWPDPETSRIVLVGTTHYRGLYAGKPIEPVAGNLKDLGAVLTAPQHGAFLSGIPYLRTLKNEDHRSVLSAIQAASDEATDVLLVYLAGHGQRQRGTAGDFYIWCEDTGREGSSRWWSNDALSFNSVRHSVESSSARCKVVIVDACYSGATQAGSMGDEALDNEDLAISGSVTYASSRANELSYFDENDRCTVFTQALVEVLREGVSTADDYVTIRSLHDEVRKRIKRTDQNPVIMQSDSVYNLALVRNRGRITNDGRSVDSQLVALVAELAEIKTELTRVGDNARQDAGELRSEYSALRVKADRLTEELAQTKKDSLSAQDFARSLHEDLVAEREAAAAEKERLQAKILAQQSEIVDLRGKLRALENKLTDSVDEPGAVAGDLFSTAASAVAERVRPRPYPAGDPGSNRARPASRQSSGGLPQPVAQRRVPAGVAKPVDQTRARSAGKPSGRTSSNVPPGRPESDHRGVGWLILLSAWVLATAFWVVIMIVQF